MLPDNVLASVKSRNTRQNCRKTYRGVFECLVSTTKYHLVVPSKSQHLKNPNTEKEIDDPAVERRQQKSNRETYHPPNRKTDVYSKTIVPRYKLFKFFLFQCSRIK